MDIFDEVFQALQLSLSSWHVMRDGQYNPESNAKWNEIEEKLNNYSSSAIQTQIKEKLLEVMRCQLCHSIISIQFNSSSLCGHSLFLPRVFLLL